MLITTYAGTAEDVVASGVPLDVLIEGGTGEGLLDVMWGALTPSLRVAALVAQPADLGGTLHQR